MLLPPGPCRDPVDDTLQAYDYELPESLIAQHPSPQRDQDRLMALNRSSKTIDHHRFFELPRLLRRGDLMVINDTRVIPARIRGEKTTGGKIELLLIQKLDPYGTTWRCMAKRLSRMRPGTRLCFARGITGTLLQKKGDGTLDLAFSAPLTEETLQAIGELPLPPYISRPAGPLPEDIQRYQTIFAKKAGAVAAPTAGLHFTPSVIAGLKDRGIEMVSLTLHVGPGTFLPVRAAKISQHKMHEEYFEIPPESAHRINQAKREGRRIIAVGTTVVRALESAAAGGQVLEGARRTSLFIHPPYEFQIIDGMITNFHLPKSTLLMLVCSFAGKAFTLQAYEEAKQIPYRFYSYGDAMLIV